MKKNLLIGLAKYGLGIALLVLVLWRNWSPAPDGSSPGLAGILQRPVQVVPLLCAVFILLGSTLLTFVRWYILVIAQGLQFTLGNAMRLGLVGFFWSTLLPAGSVGGDAVKAYCLAREQSRRTVAVATVVLDRAVGLWALFWLVALLGAVFWVTGDSSLHQQRSLQIVVLGTIGLVVVTTLAWCGLMLLPQRRYRRFAVRLNAVPKIGGSLAEFWRAIWMYRKQWRAIVAALLMSLVSHCGFVLAFYFSAQTFQEPGQRSELPTLAEHFLIVPVGMTIQALFPVPGGMGVGEYGFGRLYAMVGATDIESQRFQAGVAASLTQRLITWMLALIGAVVYLCMRKQIGVLPTDEGGAASDTEKLGTAEPAVITAEGLAAES